MATKVAPIATNAAPCTVFPVMKRTMFVFQGCQCRRSQSSDEKTRHRPSGSARTPSSNLSGLIAGETSGTTAIMRPTHTLSSTHAIEFIGRYMPDGSRLLLRGQGIYVWRDGLLRPHDIRAIAAFLLGFADTLPRWVFADHAWAGIDGKNAAAPTTANGPELGGTSWSR